MERCEDLDYRYVSVIEPQYDNRRVRLIQDPE